MDNGDRIVTFFNGIVARERLITLDDENCRLVYSVVEGRATHYNAAVQVFPEGDTSEGDGKGAGTGLASLLLLASNGVFQIVKSVIAAAFLSLACAGVASAQAADFKCPAGGTQFTFKAGTFEKVNTATGQDGNVCLFNSISDGKPEKLRVHWGLLGSVDPQGEAFAAGLDMKALWPLRVGNNITNTVTAMGRDGKNYTATVTVAVTAYEKVTVPAGTFDAFRIEETRMGGRRPSIHWWAPTLAVSVKEVFPDWRDLSKDMVLELTAVKAAVR